MARTLTRDPNRGGIKIPEKVQEEVSRRLEKYAQEHFAGCYTKLHILYKGVFCYVDASHMDSFGVSMPEEVTTKLMRLRYFGNDTWSYSFFKYSTETYALSVSASNDFFCTPEQAFDVAAGFYLGRPK